jgi:MFS transporter, OFA family, oxalate/formate antiporter
MKKYYNLLYSFVIMLCLGSVYAWSIFVPELKNNYGFSTAQTQLIFGILIATFALTMVLAGKLEHKFGPHIIAMLSAVFFSLGYMIAGLSKGSFFFVFLGIGIIGGIGTGFGYLVSITNPVKWFPDKKGLVTGIAAAGFGLGAIVLTWLTKMLLESGCNVLDVFKYVGLGYGTLIAILAILIKDPEMQPSKPLRQFDRIFTGMPFFKLVIGIFCGTFAGLLVLGNLKPIGNQFAIDDYILLLGISLFSVANFAGRLAWGWVSDFLSGRISISFALSMLSISVFLIGYLPLSPFAYLALSAAIGFSFGANFVLFAKETAHLYGINNMGYIYPFVFLGYGIAGIIGPLTGGLIFDFLGSYNYAAYIAAIISLIGATVFLINMKFLKWKQQ